MLKQIGPAARGEIKSLTAALSDSDPHVRAAATDALRDILDVPTPGKLDAATQAVMEGFIVRLGDPHEEVRIAGQLALVKMDRAALPLLCGALSHREVAIRRQTLETLKKFHPPAIQAVPDLLLALRDTDADVRQGADWTLEQVHPEVRAALPALRRLVSQPLVEAPVGAEPVGIELAYLPMPELAALPAISKDSRLKLVLTELHNRRGETALLALARACLAESQTEKELGRSLMLAYLAREPDQKVENDASSKLNLATRLAKEGLPERAQERYRRVVRDYPGTQAAEQARVLLAKAAP
jgi:HEAT repeat protein